MFPLKSSLKLYSLTINLYPLLFLIHYQKEKKSDYLFYLWLLYFYKPLRVINQPSLLQGKLTQFIQSLPKSSPPNQNSMLLNLIGTPAKACPSYGVASETAPDTPCNLTNVCKIETLSSNVYILCPILWRQTCHKPSLLPWWPVLLLLGNNGPETQGPFIHQYPLASFQLLCLSFLYLTCITLLFMGSASICQYSTQLSIWSMFCCSLTQPHLLSTKQILYDKRKLILLRSHVSDYMKIPSSMHARYEHSRSATAMNRSTGAPATSLKRRIVG